MVWHARNHGHSQHDGQDRRIGHLRSQPEQPAAGDKVTLWYQNLSFASPAISASHATTDQAMWWQGNAAYNHWVTIGPATYSCLEDSLNSAGVANNIAGQINGSDPTCTATTGGAYGNEIFITLKAGVAGPVAVRVPMDRPQTRSRRQPPRPSCSPLRSRSTLSIGCRTAPPCSAPQWCCRTNW